MLLIIPIANNLAGRSVTQPVDSGYPAPLKAGFMDGCERSGGNASVCGCILSWFESHKTVDQFMADSERIRSGALPPDELQAATNCIHSGGRSG